MSSCEKNEKKCDKKEKRKKERMNFILIKIKL